MKEKNNKIKQPPHLTTPHVLLRQHHSVTAVFSPVTNEDTEDQAVPSSKEYPGIANRGNIGGALAAYRFVLFIL